LRDLLGNKPKVSLDEMVELEKSLDLVDYSAKLRELDKKLSEIGAELSKLKAAEEVLVK